MSAKSNKKQPKRRQAMTSSHARLIATGAASGRSRVANPVQAAWIVFTATKKKLGARFTRKQAIDAALAAGVAFYTARTQYQEWKTAGDRDSLAAEKYTMQNWNVIVYDEHGRVLATRSVKNTTKEEANRIGKELMATMDGESFAVLSVK